MAAAGQKPRSVRLQGWSCPHTCSAVTARRGVAAGSPAQSPQRTHTMALLFPQSSKAHFLAPQQKQMPGGSEAGRGGAAECGAGGVGGLEAHHLRRYRTLRCMRCWISPRRNMSCRTLWMACSGYFCRQKARCRSMPPEGTPEHPAGSPARPSYPPCSQTMFRFRKDLHPPSPWLLRAQTP